MNWLCKTIGHNYSYYWICKRCGDHAGSRQLVEVVSTIVREVKREVTEANPQGNDHGA